MSPLISLKWNHHHSTLVTVFSGLRDKDLFCDMRVACGSRVFGAHRLVLAASSSYFQDILSHHSFIEGKDVMIILQDVDSDDFEILMEYMYAGEVSVEQSELAKVFKTAEKLKIRGLMECGISQLEKAGKNIFSNSSSEKEEYTRRESNESDEINELESSENIEDMQQSNVSETPEVKSENSNSTNNLLESQLNQFEYYLSKTKNIHSESQVPSTENQPNTEQPSNPDLGAQNLLSTDMPSALLDNQTNMDTSANSYDQNFIGNLISADQVKVEDMGVYEEGQASNSDDSSNLGSHSFDFSMVNKSVSTASNAAHCDAKAMVSNVANMILPSSSDNSCVPYKCTGCSYITLDVNLYSIHTQFCKRIRSLNDASSSYPSEDKPFKCGKCSYTARTQSALNYHLKTHTGIKPYVCHICQYSTIIKRSLVVHMRTHTQEKPYGCTFCSYRANQKSNLDSHMTSRHLKRM